ncbi:hypothetical protein J1N35_025641 [Gossypium stocksii]|uniref:Uncharacterized protein n=1 Tax=Gossypium stocksii TaxID=47602 RepID=A0A9D3V806_9ROSI|nr:hypothetical protein J1N35_025641 [Gossypium stocksii]
MRITYLQEKYLAEVLSSKTPDFAGIFGDCREEMKKMKARLIGKKINALKWERFCDAHSLLDDELVREFNARLTMQDATKVIVQKKKGIPKTSSKEKSINVGKNILKEIHNCAKKKTGSVYFPSFITSFCLRAHVKAQANLKGQYVQGCITNHDHERLVEKVHELNQGEQ